MRVFLVVFSRLYLAWLRFRPTHELAREAVPVAPFRADTNYPFY
jgi:hypothetical protein